MGADKAIGEQPIVVASVLDRVPSRRAAAYLQIAFTAIEDLVQMTTHDGAHVRSITERGHHRIGADELKHVVGTR